MTRPRAVARNLAAATDTEGFPANAAWAPVPALRFCKDWRGKNPDPARETLVQLLWSRENLYLRFQCRYREITVFPDAEPSGRRDKLWDRDVAEVFLQPDPTRPLRYLEFEVSPNGQWIDLAIDRSSVPHGVSDLKSGLKRRVLLNAEEKRWTAELAIPIKPLMERFNASAVWRANFYRIEGKSEPRFYSAWRPTNTPVPNFHVPEAFGDLVFARARRLARSQPGPHPE